jgi:hypothetical protein
MVLVDGQLIRSDNGTKTKIPLPDEPVEDFSNPWADFIQICLRHLTKNSRLRRLSRTEAGLGSIIAGTDSGPEGSRPTAGNCRL